MANLTKDSIISWPDTHYPSMTIDELLIKIGFLTEAIDHIRESYVKTVDDEHILQNSITGWEFKPVPFVLGLTNLI